MDVNLLAGRRRLIRMFKRAPPQLALEDGRCPESGETKGPVGGFVATTSPVSAFGEH